MVLTTGFNARSASPEDIAKSFVKPDHFDEIVKYENSVLVGPRGIGKTTLLKLLTPSGLHHYSRRLEYDVKDIDYVPIYIPSESLWKGLSRIISESVSDSRIAQNILNGVFVNYCLHEIVNGIEDARVVAEFYDKGKEPAWSIRIDKEKEIKFCKECSNLFELERIQMSFLGLKNQLLKNQNLFYSYVISLSTSRPTPEFEAKKTVMENSEYLNLMILIRGVLNIADSVFGQRKWSLNFDEMEIAPKSVLRSLFECLRSFDQRSVLKLSLFPYVDFMEETSSNYAGSDEPVEGQDYNCINLAGKYSNKSYDFSKKLIEKECEAAGVKLSDFVEYLNKSNSNLSHRINRHGGFERNYKVIFSELASFDKSFEVELAANNITLDELDSLSSAKKAFVRKLAPIAEFRLFYLKESKNPSLLVERRSVKAFSYYHSYGQLLNLTESNPRAIYIYVSALCSSFLVGEKSSVAQNRVIRKSVNRFRALIATQIVPSNDCFAVGKNALKVVDNLANRLSDNVLNNEFKSQPPMSFKFKEFGAVNIDVLGVALNVGALQAERENDQSGLIFDLTKCRVRVSHRLSPTYPLPTISGRSEVIDKLPEHSEKLPLQPDLLNL